MGLPSKNGAFPQHSSRSAESANLPSPNAKTRRGFPCKSGHNRVSTERNVVATSSTPAPSRQEAVEAAIDKENHLRVIRKPRIKTHRSFPRQRIGALTKLLLHRYGGACQTDDGSTWFDLVAPFFIRASHIEGREPFPAALAWSERFIPAFVEEIGTDGIASRVSGIIKRRDEARASGDEWLPKMPEIVAALRITIEEVRAVGLRGFGSINPPTDEERKAHRREHARKVRLTMGMKPRASCTRGKDDEALASRLGVVARTIRRWRLDGILQEKVEAMEAALPAPAMSKMCDCHVSQRMEVTLSGQSETSPEVTGTIGLSPATLDQIQREAEAKVMLELGFVGDHYEFKPETLQAIVDRHPVLRPDLKRHAATVDRLMRKTRPDNARRVARNLFADQARSTSRAATKATKLAA